MRLVLALLLLAAVGLSIADTGGVPSEAKPMKPEEAKATMEEEVKKVEEAKETEETEAKVDTITTVITDDTMGNIRLSL